MSAKYEITVSVTPLCTCCGAEMQVCMTGARATGYPFDRDNPLERTDRRVFISVCEKCFVHISIRDVLLGALKDCRSGLVYIREAHGELYGVNFDRAINAANEAIAQAEGKS